MVRITKSAAPLVILFSLILSFSGCVWLKQRFSKTHDKAPGESNPQSSQSSQSAKADYALGALKNGKTINAARLKEGGKLLIIPFKAGPSVEAGSELDQVALKIVQGVADRLKDQRPYFEVVSADGAQEAALVIKGYVTVRSREGFWRRWLLRQRRFRLRVEGRLVDPKTNETIAVFQDGQDGRGRDASHAELGYTIGQRIGAFIVSSAQEDMP